MSDVDRLKKILAGISASEKIDQDRWRVLPQAGASGELQPILREIDETVLPRLLNFRNGNGAGIQLDVAGRRLLRICAERGFSAPVSKSGLTDIPLSAFSETNFAKLAALLSEFTSGQSPVAVYSETSEHRRDPLDLGISTSDLAKALERPPVRDLPDISPTVITDFIGLCTENSCATMTFTQDKTVSQDGSERDLQMLTRIVESDLEALKRQIKKAAGTGSSVGCLLLSDGKPGQSAIVFAYSKDLMGLASGLTGNKFLGLWQDAA